jgi:RNA polymerase sigma-B factor
MYSRQAAQTCPRCIDQRRGRSELVAAPAAPEAAQQLSGRVATAPSPREAVRVARDEELWPRRDSDPAAREELIRRYLEYARKLAYRYSHGSESFEDLTQVAHLALVKAVDRYDPSRGIPFAGYATPTILGELKRHFRDRANAIRLPRSTHDLLMQVEKATEKLSVELQRSPSVSEIAASLGVEPIEVLEVFEADHNRKPVSFDAGSGEEEGHGLGEVVGEDDAGFELSEDRFAIEEAIDNLDEQDRKLLRLRFVEDMTQSEIAAEVGVSQMHVSRLLRRALERIREDAEGQDGEAATNDGEGRPLARAERA